MLYRNFSLPARRARESSAAPHSHQKGARCPVARGDSARSSALHATSKSALFRDPHTCFPLCLTPRPPPKKDPQTTASYL